MEWENASFNTPHGVMSSRSIHLETEINSASLQLLHQDPASFWNCNLDQTPCRYFRPYHFFWDKEGAGSAFAGDYKRLGGTNKNLPAVTTLSWSRRDDSKANDKTDVLPHNISFIHVHKCGGTTVKAILAQAKIKLGNSNRQGIQADLHNYKYSYGGGSVEQKERNEQMRQDHIEEIFRLQQQSTKLSHSNDGVVFAIVRDPIERFVSAVQQVMHYNEEFRNACLKWTARSTLRCAIQYAKTTNYLRDVHMVPMATHFRLWDNASVSTVKIAVLHLKDLPILAEYMAQATSKRRRGNTSDNTSTPGIITLLHGRDRSNVKYATSSILSRMSVSKDCTPKMIADLCQELYAVDVAMMASLGYLSDYCTLYS